MPATTDDAAIARELATRLPEAVAGGDLAAVLPLRSPDVRWIPDGDSRERILVLTVRAGQVADVRSAFDQEHAERLLDGAVTPR